MFSWREFQKWENKFASLIVNVHEEWTWILCLGKLYMFCALSFCLRRYSMLHLHSICNLLMSIGRRHCCTSVLSKHVVGSSWSWRLLDLQQQHRFTSLLVSGLCLLGPVQLRWPTPPPKPYQWSGLFRVAAGSTNVDGTACSACCSNNVCNGWSFIYSLTNCKLKGTIIINYIHLAILIFPLCSLGSQLCVPCRHRFYQQGHLTKCGRTCALCLIWTSLCATCQHKYSSCRFKWLWNTRGHQPENVEQIFCCYRHFLNSNMRLIPCNLERTH